MKTVTRIALVLHWREHTRTSNTGYLAWRMLENASLHLHGHPNGPLDEDALVRTGERALVLHPPLDEEPSVPSLSELAPTDQPLVLLVPDGSWPQSRRMVRRIAALRDAERVRLPPGAPSRYALRRPGRPEQLSTIEALARALALLEGAAGQETVRPLLAAFELFVRESLVVRRAGKRGRPG